MFLNKDLREEVPSAKFPGGLTSSRDTKVLETFNLEQPNAMSPKRPAVEGGKLALTDLGPASGVNNLSECWILTKSKGLLSTGGTSHLVLLVKP